MSSTVFAPSSAFKYSYASEIISLPRGLRLLFSTYYLSHSDPVLSGSGTIQCLSRFDHLVNSSFCLLQLFFRLEQDEHVTVPVSGVSIDPQLSIRQSRSIGKL